VKKGLPNVSNVLWEWFETGEQHGFSDCFDSQINQPSTSPVLHQTNYSDIVQKPRELGFFEQFTIRFSQDFQSNSKFQVFRTHVPIFSPDFSTCSPDFPTFSQPFFPSPDVSARSPGRHRHALWLGRGGELHRPMETLEEHELTSFYIVNPRLIQDVLRCLVN